MIKLRSNIRQYLFGAALIILISAMLSGCSSNPQNFTSGDLTVTLTEDFKVVSSASFDVYISSDDVQFSATEEKADTLEYAGYEIASLHDYCMELLELNKASKDSLIQRNNYYYFTNTNTSQGASFTYVHCMFKGNSSYWVCEFACKTKDYKELKDTILKWADTITIK